MDELERVFRSHNPDRQAAMMSLLQSEPAGDSEDTGNGQEEG
ncbi:MAG: hypothetical protein V2B18_25205 [Pseudomonadota bacterium]